MKLYMRYLAILLWVIFSLSLLSCDRGDNASSTWEINLNKDTGIGIIQDQSGAYLVHSFREIAKLNKSGQLLWSLDLFEELDEYDGLNIVGIQQVTSGEFAVYGIATENTERVVYLLLLDGNGVVEASSRIFTGTDFRGLSMQADENGFTFAIPMGTGNSDDRLLVVEADAGGTVLNEDSYVINRDDYAVSGLTMILENHKGYLLELVLKSISGDEVTNRKLIKLDADMNQEWSIDFGGPDFNEIRDMLEFSGGGYLLAGTYQSRGWALKISDSGTLEWDKKYEKGESGKLFFFGADETEMGNIVLTGSNNIESEGYDDLWLVTLNGEGEIRWEMTHGNAYYNFGRSVVYSRDHGYAVAGGTQNSFEEQITMWVLKLNDEGKF